MKSKIETLPNGLTLAYIKTKKKYSCMASIIVKFGGFNKQAILKNKPFEIKDGTAHFLEHLLIEHSKYGNLIFEFNKNDTTTNGSTSPYKTEFWFQSIQDFEQNLIKLINAVNNPVFTQKDIDETKDAVVQEKLEKDDSKYYEYYASVYSSLFKNLKEPNVLGEVEDIRNMKYDYIKTVYDIFYKPSNQIIVINGNINYNKIKKLILETYNSLKKKEIDSSIPKLHLTNEINIKEKIIKKDVPNSYAKIAFKIDVSKYTPLEKLKLDYYIGTFIRYILNELDEKLVKNKISNSTVSYYKDDIDNYTLLWFSLQTEKPEDFFKLLKKELKTKVPEEEFITDNKKDLIKLILREESSYGEVRPLIENILSFNYYDIDTPELIESFDYNEFNQMINDIDFTNYIVVKLEKDTQN